MKYSIDMTSKNAADWRLLRYGELAGTMTERPGSFDNAHLEFWQEIEALRGEWTKTQDDLPMEGEKCWTVWQGNVQDSLYALGHDGWECCDDDDVDVAGPDVFTHWMRANKPESPKED